MGTLGTLLYLATTGVTIYLMPALLYGTTYEALNQIINSSALNSIQSILQQIGLVEETAKQQAQQMLSVCVVVSIILAILVFSSFMESSKKKEVKKETN